MIAGLEDAIPFLRAFHRSWMETPGLDPARIPRDLPDGLVLLYRELGALVDFEPEPGRHLKPFATQDRLLPLKRLKRIDGMVEFAWENQGNWSCRSPLGPGDPAVYSNAADVWSTERRGFQKVCNSLSHFLVTLALQEAVMSAPALISLDAESLQDAMTAPIAPVWLGGWYVYGEPTHDFYTVHGKDLLMMDHNGLWVGTHDAATLDIVAARYRRNRIN